MNWLAVTILAFALYALITGKLVNFFSFAGLGNSSGSNTNVNTGAQLQNQAQQMQQNATTVTPNINGPDPNPNSILPPGFSYGNNNIEPPTSQPQPLPPLPAQSPE